MNNIAHKEEAERAERQWGISVQYNPERIDYTSLEPLAELPVVKSDDEGGACHGRASTCFGAGRSPGN